jgi:hypothetical protein
VRARTSRAGGGRERLREGDRRSYHRWVDRRADGHSHVRNTPPPPALVDESARLQNPQVWMGQDVPPTADPAEGAGGVTRGDQ